MESARICQCRSDEVLLTTARSRATGKTGASLRCSTCCPGTRCHAPAIVIETRGAKQG